MNKSSNERKVDIKEKISPWFNEENMRKRLKKQEKTLQRITKQRSAQAIQETLQLSISLH